MADRHTTPWAVAVDDDGWTIPADTREEAVDLAGAWWRTEWVLGEWVLGDHAITLHRQCTWVQRPAEDVYDPQWDDHGHAWPEADAVMVSSEATETITLRLYEVGTDACWMEVSDE